MIKYPYVITIFLFFLVTNRQNTFAQARDSLHAQALLTNTVKSFNAAIKLQSRLYNGVAFDFYDPLIKGSAYFKGDSTFSNGAVYYDGEFFNNVPIIYDVFGQNVVTVSYDSFSMFSLLNERVDAFDLLNHHFIRINADTIANNSAGLKSGYYDVLYKGSIAVLERRTKGVQAVQGSIERDFYDYNVVYLLKDNKYTVISGEGDLLNALKDKRKELQQYIKANQVKFKKKTDEAAPQIAAYYDHLSNQ